MEHAIKLRAKYCIRFSLTIEGKNPERKRGNTPSHELSRKLEAKTCENDKTTNVLYQPYKPTNTKILGILAKSLETINNYNLPRIRGSFNWWDRDTCNSVYIPNYVVVQPLPTPMGRLTLGYETIFKVRWSEHDVSHVRYYRRKTLNSQFRSCLDSATLGNFGEISDFFPADPLSPSRGIHVEHLYRRTPTISDLTILAMRMQCGIAIAKL